MKPTNESPYAAYAEFYVPGIAGWSATFNADIEHFYDSWRFAVTACGNDARRQGPDLHAVPNVPCGSCIQFLRARRKGTSKTITRRCKWSSAGEPPCNTLFWTSGNGQFCAAHQAGVDLARETLERTEASTKDNKPPLIGLRIASLEFRSNGELATIVLEDGIHIQPAIHETDGGYYVPEFRITRGKAQP